LPTNFRFIHEFRKVTPALLFEVLSMAIQSTEHNIRTLYRTSLSSSLQQFGLKILSNIYACIVPLL